MKIYPSLITLTRLIIQILVLILLILLPGKYITFIFILFICASATDKLDGYVARKLNQSTNFGMIFDVAVDKVTTLSMLLILSVYFPYQILLLPVILIIVRDLLVNGMHLYGDSFHISSKGNFYGKYKGLLELIAIYFAFLFFYPSLYSQFALIYLIVNSLLIISAAFGIISAYLYFIQIYPFIKKDLNIR